MNEQDYGIGIPLKVLASVFMCLLVAGCSSEAKVEVKSSQKASTAYGISEITTKNGVDCVLYKFESYRKGGAGIDCNWQKFNAGN